MKSNTKLQLAENKQLQDSHHCQWVVAQIKQGILGNELPTIEAAIRSLHGINYLVPEVVAHLNKTFSQQKLTFCWYPEKDKESCKLLIRNTQVGLIVRTTPDSVPEAILVTPNNNEPFNKLAPETALSKLSSAAA